MSSKMNNRICINEWKELKIDSKRIVLESKKKNKMPNPYSLYFHF